MRNEKHEGWKLLLGFVLMLVLSLVALGAAGGLLQDVALALLGVLIIVAVVRGIRNPNLPPASTTATNSMRSFSIAEGRSAASRKQPSQRHHGLEMEIKRKAKKMNTQTMSVPKAQIQLRVGRIAIMIATPQR